MRKDYYLHDGYIIVIGGKPGSLIDAMQMLCDTMGYAWKIYKREGKGKYCRMISHASGRVYELPRF